MDQDVHAFGIESYKQIRTEVSALLARVESLFRYSLVVYASVFAWLLTSAFGTTLKGQFCLKLPADALRIAWWIPASFIVLSGVLAAGTYIRVTQMGEFLKRCEQALGSNRLSWELFLAPKPPLFTTVSAVAWILMFWSAVFVANVGLSVSEDKPVCRASSAA